MPHPLVLLHGFGGTHRTWDRVTAHLRAERYRPLVVPDLPGHGESAAERPLTFASCTRFVLGRLPDEPVTLCGYSFGGRVAQHVALAAPERVARLVLVATTAGIDDDSARAARTRADARLADAIGRSSPQEFADLWQGQALFAGTAPDAAAFWREDLMRTPTPDLADALRGLSTGVMEPLWARLGELTMPVRVVVGASDSKFMAFAERYRELLPDAELVVIDGAGHGLPRERPQELARAIIA